MADAEYPAVRIFFSYEGRQVTHRASVPLDKVTPDSLPAEVFAGRISYRAEVRGSDGTVLYRRAIVDPLPDGVEVFTADPEPRITHVFPDEPSGTFEIDVPAVEGADHVVIVISDGVTETELVRAPLAPSDPPTAPAATTDGKVVGSTLIVDHGKSAERFCVALMGDGFQQAELAKFANAVDSFVAAIRTTPPYDRLYWSMNFYRVDVASTDSGAKDPYLLPNCKGSGANPNTYFDATYCWNGYDALGANTDTAKAVANQYAPGWDGIIVYVNATKWGGTRQGPVGVFALVTGNDGAIHELTHIFDIADEYDYSGECKNDPKQNTYSGSELSEGNVTISTSSTGKWADLVSKGTAMPTMKNPNCTWCNDGPNPVSATTVGTFEGARYYHCGIFRPQYACKMRDVAKPLCAVCQRLITGGMLPSLTCFLYGPGMTGQASFSGIGAQTLTNGTFVGPKNPANRLEQLELHFAPSLTKLSLSYMAHVEGQGDTGWVAGGTTVGTAGKRIEGFAFKLGGDAAARFDVVYMAYLGGGPGSTRLYANGEFCGTRGQSRAILGLFVCVVPVPVRLTGFVYLDGWGNVALQDDELAGTRGESRALQQLNLNVATGQPAVSIRYYAHIEGSGNTPWVNGGTTVGTVGKRLEGFAIELVPGNVAMNYDVWYMAHVQGQGDTGWYSNGEFCGTQGKSLRLEAMRVRLVPKSPT